MIPLIAARISNGLDFNLLDKTEIFLTKETLFFGFMTKETTFFNSNSKSFLSVLTAVSPAVQSHIYATTISVVSR